METEGSPLRGSLDVNSAHHFYRQAVQVAKLKRTLFTARFGMDAQLLQLVRCGLAIEPGHPHAEV